MGPKDKHPSSGEKHFQYEPPVAPSSLTSEKVFFFPGYQSFPKAG